MRRLPLLLLLGLAGCTWSNALYRARQLAGSAERAERQDRGFEAANIWGQVAVRADTYIISCGAVNSAALLLRSANAMHPNGLANGSDQVGRNYMVHSNTALMAVNPFKRNYTVFQKTMAINDFYFGGPDFPYPMGNIQLLGKLQAGMLAAAQPWAPPRLMLWLKAFST